MEWNHRNREKQQFQGILRLFHDEEGRTRRFGTLTKPETLYPEFFVTITLMCGLIDTKNSKGVMDDQ